MAPVGAVHIDRHGRCTPIHVAVRTTSIVWDGVVFNVVAQGDTFAFLEPDGATVPVACMLPLDIATHVLFAPTIVMRAAGAEAAFKKRKTLDVASLTLTHWQSAVTAAHCAQPEFNIPVLPAVLVPPPVSAHEKKVKVTVKARRTQGRKHESDDDNDEDEAELDGGESSSEADKDDYTGGLDDVEYDDDAEEDALDDEGEEDVEENEGDVDDDEVDGDEECKEESSSGEDDPTPKRLRSKSSSCHV